MGNKIILKEDKERLQDSLLTLRTVGGWNGDEFAGMIGVTRQYYSEIENHSRELTQSLYLATLFVLEREAKDNKDLANLFNALIVEKILSEEQCLSLSKYIASERKKKTNEINLNRAIFAIIGATTATLVGIIVKCIARK